MTIYRADRVENRKARGNVAFWGAAVSQAAANVFTARNLRAVTCTTNELSKPDFLASVGVLTLQQSGTKPNAIVTVLREHGANLLDHDIRVVVRASPGTQATYLLRKVLLETGLPVAGRSSLGGMAITSDRPLAYDDAPGPHVHVFGEAASWDLIANTIAQTPNGPFPNANLQITPSAKLDPKDNLLVARAFWDCTSIHLKALQAQGWSGALVFEAHADESGDGHASYFLKFGPRATILSEFDKYHEQVDRFVPFHLRPRLVHSRCVLGATRGLIVGDWVDDSESLLECARAGRAAPVISSLFDKTLRPWHRASKAEPSAGLGKLLRKMNEPDHARTELAKKRGLVGTPTQLIEAMTQCASSPILVGRVHGDLHAANIRARRTDAVVIDFGDVTIGPLMLDAAALEVSLLIASLDAPDKVHDWARDLASAYTTSDAYRTVPPGGDPRSEWRWLLDCVRQIRQHALLMEQQRGQYAVALANALLFKGGKDLTATGSEAETRAFAYIFAEKAIEFAREQGLLS